MKARGSAFVSGAAFAIGLGIAGMTQPAKIVAFLDVAGDWDPSLAFVMIGAIAVHGLFLRLVRTGASAAADSPPRRSIDRRLLAGAAIFGIGWGLAGFCPGPALVSLATCRPAPIAFVAAMLAGMAAAGGGRHFASGASRAGAGGAAGTPTRT